MKKNDLNKISFIIIVFSSVLIIIVLIFFILNFKEQVISNKIESWAQFGDYFGGVLNPLLALVNICVFIILSVKIQELTDSNNDKSLNESKKIAIMSMKYEELKYFKESMDKSFDVWNVDINNYSCFDVVKNNFTQIEKRLFFLFPELKESKNNLNFSNLIQETENKYLERRSVDMSNYYNRLVISYSILVSDLEKWTVS